MKNFLRYSISIAALIFTFTLSIFAQNINPAILNKGWAASWIHVPNEPNYDFGVYNFRKTFDLSEKPASFIVHVSADNRYKLYVNGTMVSLGPARGDVFHWNFETVDIAPFLKAGKNVLAAVVWQFGELRPMAQISFRTGFILQGNSEKEQIVNTDKTWKCARNEAYSIEKVEMIYAYYVVGPQEKIDYSKFPNDWQLADYQDVSWQNAKTLTHGMPKNGDWTEWWSLVPRPIPPMEITPQRFTKIRSSSNISVPAGFPEKTAQMQVPANTKMSLLIDQTYLTSGYPILKFSGGKGAKISLQYTEALYIDEQNNKDWRSQQTKANRDEISGAKRFVGPKDVIIADGGENRTFESLWYRTFRYVKVEIETQAKPLIINDLAFNFTGYPFEMKAKLDVPNDEIKKMLEVGWRTARLDAVETYMDCPFYEQLQYGGDTRIQAMISVYNAGDDRLMRNAISQMNNSRLAEGITQSRFPSYVHQEIPPFSLWWIGMLHDFYRYRADNQFVKENLAGTRQVLNWFMNLQNENGSLKKVPYWTFTDWSDDPNWDGGRPPTTEKGESAAMDLQLLWAFQVAAELEENLGMKTYADIYRQKAEQLKATIKQKYWDSTKKMFSDTPDMKLYSQHANVLAVLTETITGEDAKSLIISILDNKSLMPCSIYFKYYLHLAVAKVGLGDKYLGLLDMWRTHLKAGLTTWGEMSDPATTRSDCHAWGAHPNIEFFRILLGIDSDSPNFEKVKIQPNLGNLKQATGSIPHPKGEISVKYQLDEKGKMTAEITLPPSTSGRFIWQGKEMNLVEGINKFARI